MIVRHKQKPRTKTKTKNSKNKKNAKKELLSLLVIPWVLTQ
jgi:hypothetical protein